MVFILVSCRSDRVLLGIVLLLWVFCGALGLLLLVLQVRQGLEVRCGRWSRLLRLREAVLLVLYIAFFLLRAR